jgi:FAD-dependent oxidoreductase domain-containing protein 1
MGPRRKSYDVVIVGGGVIGSAIAYFLAADPGFGGSVLVAERDPSYAGCSTTLSVGSIRQQFSTPENIMISMFGVEFLKAIDEYLTVDGEVPDVGFVEAGYLFLANPSGLDILNAKHAVQRRCGADVDLLPPARLKERFSWMAVEDLAAGSLGVDGEGWFDPYALLQAFRRKARSLGVEYVADEVVGMTRSGSVVDSVGLQGGGEVACGTVVNAAGPRAAEVAAMATLELPVRSRKRFVFSFLCASEIKDCPLVIDPTGLYFRPEGAGFITGISPPPEEDPDCLDYDVDYDLFEERIWPILAARVPAFEAIKQTRAWAGHYAFNTVDQNAILGPHPEVGNFYFANGFSGHGIQQAPAVGRALSELIVGGAFRGLDLSRLSYGRLVSGEPLRELNVV